MAIAFQGSKTQAMLKSMASACIQIAAAQIVPVAEEIIGWFLPASTQAEAAIIEAAINPAAETAVAAAAAGIEP
jgi:hypothetical protein